MSDAWTLLAANATDTTDAWTALNSQQATSGIPGKPIDEIRFTLADPFELAFEPTVISLEIAVEAHEVTAPVVVDAVTMEIGEF